MSSSRLERRHGLVTGAGGGIGARVARTPDETAGAAVFLASDEARHITAQTLNVDGGNVMS